MNKTIFLLGAGASVDAGMPTVDGLTQRLRERLPNLQDANGNVRPEFGSVFDYIVAQEPSVAKNYERFFEWVKLLLDAAKEPFRKIITVNLQAELLEAMFHLPYVIGDEIASLLESYRTEPIYLAKLRDFIPDGGRLKVFTLNYDCCLEDACRSEATDITTGFDPRTRKWKPSLFRSTTKGVSLYKLHGSLRWFLATDNDLLDKGILENQAHYFLEVRHEERGNLPAKLDIGGRPELVLGPGSKMQVDDPFLTLFYEFHSSIRRATACVVIGYGYRDPHVNEKLDEAIKAGAIILDVNPVGPRTKYLASSRYKHLKLSAKSALTSGQIQSELKRLIE